jgi:hypothetical protein
VPHAGTGTGYCDDATEAVSEREDPVPTPGGRRAGSTPARQSLKQRFLNPRVGPSAVIALAALIGLVAWLVITSTGSKTSKSNTGRPVVLSLSGLKAFAKAASQPIYWIGGRPSTMYEITKNSTGVYLRYLPAGAKAGDPRRLFTIATYPLQNAYAITKTSSKGGDSLTRDVTGGGVATYHTTRPTSVYVAYPGSAFQVEVYHPRASIALRVATSGRVQPVVKTAQYLARGPVAVLPADLRSLATSLGHPIYWAGPRANTIYELWQTSNGYTYIRYLPRSVPVGASARGRPYLIVATYPMKDAFNVTRTSSSKSKSSVTMKLPDGGFAAYAKQHPTNVYVAYPGVNVQVEVYNPLARVTPKLVASGQIVPVR